MRVKIDNKVVNIPNEELEKNMKLLDITQEEAIQMYLEDNEYIINQEQEELTKKAKANGTNKPKADKKPRAKKEVAPKENPTKSGLIKEMAQFLTNNSDISNVKIENPTKIITFELENKHFKLDLIQKREPKAK